MILDPAEISRLTAAPNMQQIYVSGNPFTRTHATYRIDIFNYFRMTAGFTEDILVDGSMPGVMERRHLVDRVFEKPPLPPPTERLLSPPPLQAGTVGRNARRKKPARQRIVSLDDGGSQSVASVQSPRIQPGDRDGGDEYRRRLEALREEAGTGWLRVLSESPGFVEKTGKGQKGKEHA
jgi:hypothetical protein